MFEIGTSYLYRPIFPARLLRLFFPFHPFSRSVAIWSDSLPSSLREPPSGSMASIRTPRRSPWSLAWCSAGRWNLRLPQAVEHGDPYSWGTPLCLPRGRIQGSLHPLCHGRRLGFTCGGGGIDAVFQIGIFRASLPLPLPLMLQFV